MSTITQEPENTTENVIRFRLDDALWERLQIFKIKNRTTVQAIAVEAITEYLNNQKRPESRARAS